MNDSVAPHPNDEVLHAYGLGMLQDPAAAAAVDSHLEECEACQRRVSELSGDDFVGRLREVGAGMRSVAPRPAAAPGLPPSRQPELPARERALGAPVPPELAGNSQYEVLRELGRGGMGVVYLAQNRMLDRLEVLKVLNKEMLERKGTYERFVREIRAAARLNHPNVVAAYSAQQVGPLLVFAMEYIQGHDLTRVVKAKGPLPVNLACAFVHDAALGLEHAHERGMVHRDIKPANLMYTRGEKGWTVKVLDFGLAKATSENPFDGSLTREGQMLGTVDYIAPEQSVDAQKADIRADIYSLGCTFYYLLTGGPPFEGPGLGAILQAHHSLDARPLNVIRPDVSVELAAVVAKMMAKEPHRRYQTPLEVAQALRLFFRPKPAAAPEPSIAVEQAGGKTAAAAPAAAAAGPAAASPKTPAVSPSQADVSWEGLIAIPEPEGLSELKPQSVVSGLGRPKPRGAMLALATTSLLLLGLLGVWVAGISRPDARRGHAVLDGVSNDKGIAQGKNGPHGPNGKPWVQPIPTHAPAPTPDPVPAPGFVALFNGKDLTGWNVPGNPNHRWKVVNGVIVSAGPPTFSRLDTTRADFDNFHLRVETKLAEGNDAAINFRVKQTENEGGFYATVIPGSMRTGTRTGDLARWTPEHKTILAKAPAVVPIRPGEWFTQEIIADGNAITVLVQGKEVVKCKDPDRTLSSGAIGLFCRGNSTVMFRKVEIKELPKSRREDSESAATPAPPKMAVESKAITNSIGMKLVLIPAGEFLMGALDSDREAHKDEKPQHRVRITRPFYLGATEVTQGQYRTVTGESPGRFKGSDDLPVEQVSWNDAVNFCNALSRVEGLPPFYRVDGQNVSAPAWKGAGYRLPTEAEWEYACRAQNPGQYSFGDDPAGMGEYAWFYGNSGNQTHPVGQKRPNGFGLFDMHGNVNEWCSDGYQRDFYARSPVDDPVCPFVGAAGRVYRGGGWGDYPRFAQSAIRFGDAPSGRGNNLGFRVARVQSEASPVRPSVPEVIVNPPAPPADKKPAPTTRVPGPLPTPAREEAPKTVKNYVGMKLVLIPAGEFPMGSPDSENDAQDAERPQHRVRITRPFYLGATEVTQGQYRTVTGESPSRFKGSDDLPVEMVSWFDAVNFCNTMSRVEGLPPFYRVDGPNVAVLDWKGPGYRLPTEAEREYACRARNPARYSFGDDPAGLGEYAWFSGNSGSQTHPVGQKGPNGFGLFDMYGNVREWCSDDYRDRFYTRSPVDDPVCPIDGAAARVYRGGGWTDIPWRCRSASRLGSSPGYRYDHLGFRVARVQSGH